MRYPEDMLRITKYAIPLYMFILSAPLCYIIYQQQVFPQASLLLILYSLFVLG